MNKQTLLPTLIAGVAAFLSVATPVVADTCTTQYGGSTTCTQTDLTVNKQVYNPIKKVYVENLGVTDATFSAGDEVLYRLVIHNASGETFNPVSVKDVLPPYLTFVAGPGTYTAATRTLEFKLENVIAGQTRTVEVLAKVVDKKDLPDQKAFCVTNTAQVSALNRFDSDTAQMCIQTQVLGTTTLPIAGFNDLMLVLPFLGVGLGGLALLRNPEIFEGKKKS